MSRAKVLSARGPHFKSIGRADSTGTIYLIPEEVIYLLERGSMSLYNPRGDTRISLQGCYTSCLRACGGLERYVVYAYLKRLGFIVQRANTFDDNGQPELPVVEKKYGISSLWSSIVDRFLRYWKQVSQIFQKKTASFGPIIRRGVWRSYGKCL